MIHYRHKKPRILFVGINPHFGSFNRGVPFSNNKMFWYLLSDSGILKETRADLRDDDALRRFYKEKFNDIYGLGFVNIIDRPTLHEICTNLGADDQWIYEFGNAIIRSSIRVRIYFDENRVIDIEGELDTATKRS